MSTAKWFILIAVISIVAFIILGGSNPFGFGDAYFRPRVSPSPIPDNSLPTKEKSDINNSDVEVGEGVNIDR